jgi:hypothetical protein
MQRAVGIIEHLGVGLAIVRGRLFYRGVSEAQAQIRYRFQSWFNQRLWRQTWSDEPSVIPYAKFVCSITNARLAIILGMFHLGCYLKRQKQQRSGKSAPDIHLVSRKMLSNDLRLSNACTLESTTTVTNRNTSAATVFPERGIYRAFKHHDRLLPLYFDFLRT